jgi:tRNA dimethylallyltransferase
MRILSQAPSGADSRGIRHHLVSFIPPGKNFSVAEFRKAAAKKIRQIFERGHTPIVVGGSGLYAKALMDGLFPSPGADLKFRARMARYASRHGSPALHDRLKSLDPEAAGKIHPNDSRRIIRALEVHHLTGETFTDLKRKTKGLKDEFDIFIFGLTGSRDSLYDTINRRVDGMAARGLIDEVRRLMKKRLSMTAREVLGFKEISGYLRGEYGYDEAIELLKKNTRNFAKRQLSWFRQDNRIMWFDLSKTTEGEIIRRIWKRLC